MKYLLAILLFLNVVPAFSQKVNSRYERSKKDNAKLLGSVLQVDNIVSITVTNYAGKHTLTQKELVVLKGYLKQAREVGGLTVKPQHVMLDIRMKGNKSAGYVYTTTGTVHFDSSSGPGRSCRGSWDLPIMLNFENYR
ncbi:hypothetical protein SAMN05428949_0842 [Chitinophaga sp. YR627]|uniref:hypothetical protein n=1 Tax=Chitinophaga sp. YR627 TaxID=1881041 RepID=UPI0008F2F93D|nr:hypothetical protein [Chitinophaga sp. YR627]SFM80113.1 hypothetical protein SAMN05428949_0842 [Chitinophaga sp. YR627]